MFNIFKEIKEIKYQKKQKEIITELYVEEINKNYVLKKLLMENDIQVPDDDAIKVSIRRTTKEIADALQIFSARDEVVNALALPYSTIKDIMVNHRIG